VPWRVLCKLHDRRGSHERHPGHERPEGGGQDPARLHSSAQIVHQPVMHTRDWLVEAIYSIYQQKHVIQAKNASHASNPGAGGRLLYKYSTLPFFPPYF
jgi:hypothetical protein